jgi:hypothetical protein
LLAECFDGVEEIVNTRGNFESDRAVKLAEGVEK